jgi:hypothetical protein
MIVKKRYAKQMYEDVRDNSELRESVGDKSEKKM